jgi:hypothetical protein
MILLRVVARGEYGMGEGLRRVRGRLERGGPWPVYTGVDINASQKSSASVQSPLRAESVGGSDWRNAYG